MCLHKKSYLKQKNNHRLVRFFSRDFADHVNAYRFDRRVVKAKENVALV